MLTRTPEEIAVKKAELVAEYKGLPDKSHFGNDNRAAEKLMLKTFERIEKGEDITDMIDEMYDRGDDPAQEYICDQSIGVLEWAEGAEGAEV